MMTPAEAEELAAGHMRGLGFVDATATGAGADGGLDVYSTDAVAQVKLHFKPIGRPDLQRLFGARAHGTTKAMLFYSFAGYSDAALKYADSVQMALFTFDMNGKVTECNETAQLIGKEPPAPAVWVAPPLQVFYSTPPEATVQAPTKRGKTRKRKSKSAPDEQSKWYGGNTIGVTPPERVKQAPPPLAKNTGRRQTPESVEATPHRNDRRKMAHRELLEQQQVTRQLAMSSRTDDLISEWEKLPLDTVIAQLSVPRKKAMHEDQLAEYVRRRRDDEPESSAGHELSLQAPTATTSPAQSPGGEHTPTSTPKAELAVRRNRSTLRQSLADPALHQEKRRIRNVAAPIFGVATIATLIPVFVGSDYSMVVIPLLFACMTALAIVYSRIPSQ